MRRTGQTLKPASARRFRWLALAALAAALLPLPRLQVALAADQTVSTCTEADFDAALNAVQSSGGGTITFDCTGTIFFTGQKTITRDVTIIGNGGVVFDGDDSTRLFFIHAGATLNLTALTLQNGFALDGAAVFIDGGELTVIASTFSGNHAGFGGAIATSGESSTATIMATTFSGNSADELGGAILNNPGSVTVIASNFRSNSAEDGGAILSERGGSVTVTASTFSDNTATSDGGAVQLLFQGTLTVAASTFSGNSAGSGAAIDNFGDGTLTITASILAASSTGGNCSGTITSGGSNLSDDDSCGFANSGDIQDSEDVNLGALADNGGPTETMLPQADSDAIDAADCALSSDEDQRGADRPDPPATTCDIGAVEVGATIPVQIFAVYNASGMIDEGDSATIQALAFGPDNDNLDYDFDCNGDGSIFETQGSGNLGTAECTFSDDGSFTVGVQVCDAGDAGNCDTSATSVAVANLPPTITGVANDGPADEGSLVTITVTATDPAGANDPLTYSFDCDNNGSFETAGVGNQGQCVFDDDGSLSVGVQVADDDGGTATDATTVTVNNVPPTITNVANSGPVNEGGPVTITVTATDPAGANDPLMYEFDCDNSGGYEVGPQASNSAACTFGDNGAFPVPVRVTDDDGGEAASSSSVTVNNVPPTIEGITTNGPVSQGLPVTIAVVASDPAGVNDPLIYAFDCDEDGTYETPGVGSTGICPLDPAAATTTIGVQVSDDDLGTTTDTVVVGQTLTLCLNYATGAFGPTGPGGGCGAGTAPFVLSASNSVTLCINPMTGGLRWSPGGSCVGVEWAHHAPDDGPLSYCAHNWTRTLRFSWNGQCTAYEMAGVIPG